MNWINRILHRARLNQDLSDEIQSHLEERVIDLVESGMSPDEARRTARREFGNVTALQEQGREVWRWTPLEDFLSDTKFALRQLRKSPAFTTAAVLTLALGIGANTVVFSIVNAVILRPLSYGDPDRLVAVQSRDIRNNSAGDYSYPNFFDIRERTKVFEHIVCFRDEQFSLTTDTEAVHLRGYIVSWDLFPMLGVQPALGRTFLPSEETVGDRSVILSHSLFTTRFASNPAIIGSTIRLDSIPHTVVGVAPEGLRFPVNASPAQLWVTLAHDAASATVQPVTQQRGNRMLNVMARLKPGITVQQAQLQTDESSAALARLYPDPNRYRPATFVRPALEVVTGSARNPLFLILTAVGLVLLIACANIANLLLGRTAERTREFALRASIGAGRARIARQILTESLTLSVLGSIAGVLAAAFTIRYLVPLTTNAIPRIQDTSIDSRVLAFSAALAFATSLIFGFAPAWRIRNDSFSSAIRNESRTSTERSDWLRSALCVAQIALGLVLMTAASLLTASFLQITRSDPGFSPHHVLAFNLSLPGQDYPKPRQLRFYDEILERLSIAPGSAGAALAMPLPHTGSQMVIGFNIEERPTARSDRPSSDMAIVSPSYFRTLEVPLLEGRNFTPQDSPTAPLVLIVNRAFAEKFFPGQSAVGKIITPGALSDSSGPKPRQIVGVVGNAKQSALNPPAPIYYFPFPQLSWCCPALLVRTAGDPNQFAASARAIVRSIDRQIPVYNIRTLDDVRHQSFAVPRFLVLLLSSFAAIALLLTIVGLYGVLAYSVIRRTRELGVRIALGATRANVLGMVLKQAIQIVAAGLVLGMAGALAAGKVIAGVLYGIKPNDPFLLGIACAIISVTAILAAWLPARRAAAIDPIQALRAD